MSDRDKKLLVYLGALIILAAAYFLVGKPFLDKIDQLSMEKTQLEAELREKREAYENKDVYENGITESQEKMDAIIEQFPEDNSDEKSIMFASHAEADIPIWFNQMRFAEETKMMINGQDEESASDVEQAQLEENVAAAEGESTGDGADAAEGAPEAGAQNGGTGLADLMYRDTELGLSTGLVNGTMVLSQWAVLGPGRELPEVVTDVDAMGTDNVFTNSNHGGSILDLLSDIASDFLSLLTGEIPEEALDELGTDYIVKVNAVTDNTNGKTIGRADDATETTYVTSSINKKEDVNFKVTGSDGTYDVYYKIGKNEYTDTISKEGDAKLYIRVISTTRMTDDDESAVGIHVVNESDIPVIVNIEGDDTNNPRVTITERAGNVTVNGGQ